MRTATTTSGRPFLCSLLLIAMGIGALPTRAQENRWKELNNRAVNLYEQGKYPEAIQFAQEALRVAEEAFGRDDLKTAASLNNLAFLYDDLGQYAEAEPLYQRALAIHEKALGPDHPDVATSLNNLAGLFKNQARFAEAESFQKRALAIQEKTLGPDDPDVAASLNNLAELCREQGKYADAEPLYQRALAIQEKTLGPDDPDLATFLNNLALLYDAQGRYAEAEPIYQRALVILEKALGADHPAVANSLNNLAMLYDSQARHPEAAALYQRALRIQEKALGPEHPDVATSLSNLAEVYDGQGRYAESESLHKRALAIREKALGPDHPDVAISLGNLAGLYRVQGKYAQAEPLFLRALAIKERALGSTHPDLAPTLNGLAELYKNHGRYADAEPLQKRALAIREKAFGPEHPGIAASLNNLAELYRIQARYAEAEPLYARALAINEKALGPGHPRVATSLNNVALLSQAQGRYAEAEALFDRASATLEKALGPDHPETGNTVRNLARLFYAADAPARAQPVFERGQANLARQFNYSFTYMSEKERLGFLETVSASFPIYLSFCSHYRDKNPVLTGKMYNLLLWQKGLIAQSIGAMRTQVAASGNPELLKLLDQLTARRARLASLSSAPPTGLEPWREQVRQLEQESNDIERELVQRSSALAQQKKLLGATWTDVQKALGKDDAAVEFVRFDQYDGRKWTGKAYYAALVVRPASTQPEMVVLGEAQDLEGKAVVEYRARVATRGVTVKAAEVKEEPVAGPPPGAALYQAFWKPLEAALAGARRVFVSPDGVLNQMPLGILPRDDGTLVMETYDLRIVSSTKDLLRKQHPAANRTAVLIGNPRFDLPEAQQRAATAKLATTQPQTESAPAVPVAAGLRSRDQQATALIPLPGTETEIQAIAPLLEKQQWQVRTYLQSSALEDAVKKVQAPRVLHVATHGFFLSDQALQQDAAARGADDAPGGLEDPMLRSGLYFAGADRTLSGQSSAELEDGVLTAYEATGLNLQGTELVVLSACETGLGEVQNGEGVFGLRRALQVAGAESVLMSMWSVPDRETQELMSLFYAKWLGGKEKHLALREAQLEMREAVKQRYGRDIPFYWGAFVLVGR